MYPEPMAIWRESLSLKVESRSVINLSLLPVWRWRCWSCREASVCWRPPRPSGASATPLCLTTPAASHSPPRRGKLVVRPRCLSLAEHPVGVSLPSSLHLAIVIVAEETPPLHTPVTSTWKGSLDADKRPCWWWTHAYWLLYRCEIAPPPPSSDLFSQRPLRCKISPSVGGGGAPVLSFTTD